MNKVCATLVVYKPDLNILKIVIEVLSDQCGKVYIFINSKINDHTISNYLEKSNVEIHGNGENIGIARAQNILLTIAIEEEYEYVLTSDQDTIYPKDFISKAIGSKVWENKEVIAVGPLWRWKIKEKWKVGGITVFNRFGYIKSIIPFDEYQKVSHLISSGMLIRLDLLKNVGLMNEDFFIDWVDNEWCWRAISKGYSIYVNKNLIVDHSLGDKQKNLLGIIITERPILRQYYTIRNGLNLILYHNFHYKIKLYISKKILNQLITFWLTSKMTLTSTRMIVESIYDGLTGKKGEYNKN